MAEGEEMTAEAFVHGYALRDGVAVLQDLRFEH